MASAEFDSRNDAAEYVLGTLDVDECAAFEARMAHDPALTREVEEWRRHLAALNEETQDVEPPAEMFASIMERIGGYQTANVALLKRRVKIWRSAAIAVSAIAASLVLFVSLRTSFSPPQKGLYVAVLQGTGTTPAFVAAVDVRSKLIVVRSLGTLAPADHSYELWALGAGRTAPQPLGVVEAMARIPADRLGRLGEASLADTTFAVSLEPVGGSPTGTPTGPVLFTGKLLSTD